MKVVLYGSPVADRVEWLAAKLGESYEVVSVDYAATDVEKHAAFEGARAIITVRYDLAPTTGVDLKLIQVPGVGCDEIDTDLIPPGATLCNVHGHNAGVAEFVVLQILEWCHATRAAQESFRHGSWERSSRFGARPHRELYGSTVGIVGYGGIGRALATRLRPFGVRILVANRSPIDDMACVDEYFPLDRTGAMFEACDFGIVAIALTDVTEGLIGESELAAMGSEGVLVNVARAPVVNEDALWACLSDGRLGGAVLDVWYRYPANAQAPAAPSRHPFLDLKAVVGTPHIAGWTEGTVERRWSDIVENILRIGADKPFLNVVRPAEDI